MQEKIKMNIFESLENLNVSEECFNDIMDIVEEILTEANYSVKEVKEKAEKVLPSRIKALKKGSQNPSDPEAQRNLSRARRAAAITELPNSKRSFKTVQQAADKSVQGRKTAKEHNDKVYSEVARKHDDPEKALGVLNKYFQNIPSKKDIKRDNKRYFKSVGLSSKKGYTHPVNRSDISVKGHKVETGGESVSHEYQNRFYQ